MPSFVYFNKQIGRDERVHLSANDVIDNEKCEDDSPHAVGGRQHLTADQNAADGAEVNSWPPSKSENLLQDAGEQGKRKTICKKIQGECYPVKNRAC